MGLRLDPELLGEALGWLGARAHENLGTEIVLRRAACDDAWAVTVSRRRGELTGVSVAMPGGCAAQA